MKRGYKLITDGTDNHIVLMSCIDKGLTGSKMENACDDKQNQEYYLKRTARLLVRSKKELHRDGKSISGHRLAEIVKKKNLNQERGVGYFART